MVRKQPILHAAALAALLALVPWGSFAESESAGPLEFAVEDIDANTVTLAEYRGEWVVVNFWATWCKPCRKEMPELDAMHRERDDISVIGLAFEDVGPEAIREFLNEYPATYPIALVDVYEPPDTFGVPRVLPTTVLVAPDGYKVKTILGPVTRKEIERFVDEYPAGES